MMILQSAFRRYSKSICSVNNSGQNFPFIYMLHFSLIHTISLITKQITRDDYGEEGASSLCCLVVAPHGRRRDARHRRQEAYT
ncbi:unnamed protein product [Citrullus colocynthis]|uniref:Uncharacterized protein n=1 Tax=Citrullus colocynthis TaxID=252529 RepID=A0ABP0Z804_9ROSI